MTLWSITLVWAWLPRNVGRTHSTVLLFFFIIVPDPCHGASNQVRVILSNLENLKSSRLQRRRERVSSCRKLLDETNVLIINGKMYWCLVPRIFRISEGGAYM